MADHDELDVLASGRFGLVRWTEAVELLGGPAARSAVRLGRLIRVGPGVYRCEGTAASFRQRVLAACLAYGPLVAASHATAARLWGAESVATVSDVEVSVPRRRNGALAVARTHRVRLDERDVSERFAIPVTTPARTLRDLAGHVPVPALERAVDDLLRCGHLDLSAAEAMLRPCRGYEGAAELRRVLRERLQTVRPGDSLWVDRIVGWLRDAGLPTPMVQFQVVVGDHVRVLDLAYPAERVAVEFHGWEFHQTRSRADADHARTTELELEGWIVVVVTSAHPPAAVVGWIRRALEARRALADLGGGGRGGEITTTNRPLPRPSP